MIAFTKYFTERALRTLAAEVRGLQRAAYVLAIFAILSSLLALIREHIFAHLFGAGTIIDVYQSAFRIPDYLFVIMGALVSVYVLIPELSRRDDEGQRRYIDTIVVGFSLLCMIVCGIAAIIAPYLLGLLFPKLVAAGLLLPLTGMTRIILLQPVLLGFSNIFAAITQSRHRYLLYAISPLLYNFGIILGSILLYPFFGMMGLALGVVFGAFLHAAIQIPSIVKDGFFHRLPRLYDLPALARTIFTSAPRALALSMSELAETGLLSFAGLLITGSIATFSYAYTLQGVSVTIIGASYSVAAFPALAAALAKGQRQQFIDHVATAARYVIFWSLPATALCIVLRAHIVRVILGSGQFNWTNTRLVAAAFGLFALSLGAQGLMLLIVRAYYAAGRSFVPFFISSCMAVATIAMGAASVGALHIPIVLSITEDILRVVAVPGVSVLALAFAFSFVSIIGTVFLIAHFETRFRGFLRLVYRSWLEALCAALGGGIGAYLALNSVGQISFSSTVFTVFLRGAFGGLVGILVTILLYAVQRNREYEEIVAALKTRVSLKRQLPNLAPEIVTAAEEQIPQ
jgi:putative peptidoglycan lipid II flippase